MTEPRKPRTPHQRAFHYRSMWKPNGTRFEIERFAEWCEWYPKERRRVQDRGYTPSAPLTPQLVSGRIGYRLAENECKLLRAACRQIRDTIRRAQVDPKMDTTAGGKEAYEIVRFNLRIAEWAREYLMGKVNREDLIARFEARRTKHGFPGINAAYARKVLYLKIVQFAF